MNAIELLDAEQLRAKLRQHSDPGLAEALAYYDQLAAQGHKPALYLEGSTLVVGTINELPSQFQTSQEKS